MSGFEIYVTTIQPGQAGAGWRPEDELHLEDVKTRKAGTSARDVLLKKLCLTENYAKTKILHLYLRDLE